VIKLCVLSRAAGFALSNFTIITLPSLAVVFLTTGAAEPIDLYELALQE